jgi:ribosomal protein S18 acetylase RimI-like enzyme
LAARNGSLGRLEAHFDDVTAVEGFDYPRDIRLMQSALQSVGGPGRSRPSDLPDFAIVTKADGGDDVDGHGMRGLRLESEWDYLKVKVAKFGSLSHNVEKFAVQFTCAVLEDTPAVARVHVDTWKAAYAGMVPDEVLSALSTGPREAMWRESITRGFPDLVVAKENDQVAGFISFGACRDENVPGQVGEIYALYVLSAQWSQGVGRGLWLYARDRLMELGYQSVSLWVFAENARAIKFYLAAGFVLDPLRTHEVILGGKRLPEARYVRDLI